MAALLLQLPAALALYRAASSLSSLHHSVLLPKDPLILPNTIPFLGLGTTLLPSTPAVSEPVVLPLEGISILCLIFAPLPCPSHLGKTTRDSSLLCFRLCPSSPCAMGTSASWFTTSFVVYPLRTPFLHVCVQNPSALSAAALLVPNTLPKGPVSFQ